MIFNQKVSLNKFSVILADPPWAYNSRAAWADTRFGGGVSANYSVMSDQEIFSLKKYLDPIIHESSTLLLWAVAPKLDIAQETVRQWGFKYSTVAFVWEKITSTGDPATGPGFWTASNAEFVLLGWRGKRAMDRVERMIQSVIRAPRTKHSEKPIEVHRRIERMFGHVSRLELFGRRLMPGWTVLGNEITGRDIREDLDMYRRLLEIKLEKLSPHELLANLE